MHRSYIFMIPLYDLSPVSGLLVRAFVTLFIASSASEAGMDARREHHCGACANNDEQDNDLSGNHCVAG